MSIQAILEPLKLLIPALIPSWRFFDRIGPSPRIEFSMLQKAHETPDHWQEFRAKPAHVSVRVMLQRLLWNPRWNESLYITSCAERFLETGAEIHLQEIVKRITAEVAHTPQAAYLRIRIVLVSRQGETLHRDVAFLSPLYVCASEAAA